MRLAITVGCLVIAIALYALGIFVGASIFLAAGILFEAAFWARIFKRKSKVVAGEY
jgi:uncharacterized membrane protein